MFSRILIANRGEIACRIIKTCRRMGIYTIAVYSEADARALHVDLADEAHPIGLSPAHDSYLNSRIIIETAKKVGAQAIHPGYGFLSENSEFSRAVESAGLIFIGPSSKVIQLMGDKLMAKSLASQAGVNLIPGSDKPVTKQEEVRSYAKQHGYPILLKAAAGGGGKGMRVIYSDEEIEDSLTRTTSEALSSFDDGRVFVEKYVEDPRHIEIQILGDTHGNIIHLGERDCSLQRRHQKVIEETPSPFMTDKLRQAMVKQALSLAKQVGYTSAGTVEFMVTPEREFYFLEMNTRLQVEHPVTEMVTNFDLVEEMIRIANGEPLSLTQEHISFSGHAIEARIYAEDANEDFRPSCGRITRYEPPVLTDYLRLDTGIEAGSEISIYYDPMIAKLISWGMNREEAIRRLRQGLSQFIIEGPVHNTGFLEQLLFQKKVQQGDVTTHFIEKKFKGGLSEEQRRLVYGIAGLIHKRMNKHNTSLEWVIVEKDVGSPITIKDEVVTIARKKIKMTLEWHPMQTQFVVHYQGAALTGLVHIADLKIIIKLYGVETTLEVVRPKTWELLRHVTAPEVTLKNKDVKAPMPGILVSLSVSKGDYVSVGQPLLVIEAMKMENVLRSPGQGLVKEILANPGDSLKRDQLLMKLG